MLKRFFLPAMIICLLFSFKSDTGTTPPYLKIAGNHHYFSTDGKPFFWLGDTGWLLFSKLNRQDAENYLEVRKKQGFNVIQVMVLHSTAEVNAYGDSALINRNITMPRVTPGDNVSDPKEYDYWDHVDWIVNAAAKKGMYIAMVPVWGSVVKGSHVNQDQAKAYATFLANRYRSFSNVIWMNGGDIAGSDSLKVWNAIGNTLHTLDPRHLITFHPRGRKESSIWFQQEPWLSFNCFQSGHRAYAQDTSKTDFNYGEDNWRYVEADYNKKPIKPTLDAEPSYENIPRGLHDTTQRRWTAADVRRYAYWSVFAGACGFTYGNNDVMQMHKPGEGHAAYGSKNFWFKSVNDPGAREMDYLKKLMLSRPYFERVPDQSLIAGQQGEKYNRLIATRGKKYAFVYTYTGRTMEINTSVLSGSKIKASWYNPQTGNMALIGTFDKSKSMKFDPPGQPVDGNDWVLVLDAI
jgi:hypothetical protein